MALWVGTLLSARLREPTMGESMCSTLPLMGMVSLTIICLSTTAPTIAGDEAIRRTMLQLADKDQKVRQAAIEALAASEDARLVEFLESYRKSSLYLWNGQLVLCEQMVTDEDYNKHAPLSDPLTREPLTTNGEQIVVPSGDLEQIKARRPDRKMVREGILRLELSLPDIEKRRAAVKKLGDRRVVKYLPQLQQIRDTDKSERVRYAARESILLIRLDGLIPGETEEDRLAAARELGEMRTYRAHDTLLELLKKLDKAEKEGRLADSTARDVYQEALERIDRYQRIVNGVKYLFQGLSRGSVLILMALGLSIIFGQMGVINMAHGELMMIGAIATYTMQRIFDLYFPQTAFDWYYIAALPVAVFSAALVGYLIEILVVRHLYGRPLETLLATWGIGLVLIVTVRLFYGYNIGVNAPTWARGGFEIIHDVIIPYSRMFIIALAALCVVLVYLLMNFTKMGLLVRATMQDREMADSLGVNTRRIDGYTFALGAGLAGIAGWGVTLIAGVSPNMGSTYIVDSFLVVVTGGVGELAGTVWAGLGLGVIDKFLEPIFGAVWGKVVILICIVLFIQWRPQGLFPPKGRLADVV